MVASVQGGWSPERNERNIVPESEIKKLSQCAELAQRCVNETVTQADIELVERQLNRYPRGMVAVGARCVCGKPLAVVTRPLLPDGTPFPTTCYLTSPEAVKAVSHLEADGVMREYNELLETNEEVRKAYETAHTMYITFRHELAVLLEDSEEHVTKVSAGGMPVRVKCLHALLAQTLIMGEGVNPIGDLTLKRISQEFSPNICRCSVNL